LNHHRQSFGYLLYILILISPILTMLFSATSRQLTSSASRAVLWKRLFPATRTQSTSVVVASSWTQADVQLRDRYNTPQQEPLDANEVRRILSEDEQIRSDLAYCLAFAHDESDFTTNSVNWLSAADATGDDATADSSFGLLMNEQLERSQNQLRRKNTFIQDPIKSVISPRTTTDSSPLPRTLQDALRPTKRRAIVITEATAPFRIVQVNSAWEDLCGYTFTEAKGKTLGSLLHGPDTNPLAATSLITQLLRGEPEAGTTLINYTKDKRRFCNRIRVGPLVDEQVNPADKKVYFVGVLQEVKQMQAGI